MGNLHDTESNAETHGARGLGGLRAPLFIFQLFVKFHGMVCAPESAVSNGRGLISFRLRHSPKQDRSPAL